MLIESQRHPVALFLFAHQDDEFGAYAHIESEREAGRRVVCVFVTDGAATAPSARRDDESRRVLAKLGVSGVDILFIGRAEGFADGSLHLKTEQFARWLSVFVSKFSDIERCFVPAWEGGHPDHDLVHALAVRQFAETGEVYKLQQFPLYHGCNCMGPFFKVLQPLPENGAIFRKKIAVRDRLRYLAFCFAYASQWKTWVGLFPFVLVHYIVDPVQTLQSVNVARVRERPHSGSLYYERRGFLDWPTLQNALDRAWPRVPASGSVDAHVRRE